jgi:hypothetical protein
LAPRFRHLALRAIASAFALTGPGTLALTAAACRANPGNDPNVPDDELPFAGVPAEAAPNAPCSATLPPPSSCASVPSYASQIRPIIARSCVPMCHEGGGTSSDRNLTTYANVSNIGISILTPVINCTMPPADAGADAQITATEREEILQWLVCRLPDN